METSRPSIPVRYWTEVRSLFLACIGTIVLVFGCDTSVQALKPSTKYHYSVFGVLNPIRDTQWVRVEPLGTPTSEGAPQNLGVTVTLENLNSGRKWTLQDSLVDTFAGVPGEPQHNFWTTAPIDVSTSYRLVVRNDEGDTTTATTTTPDGPPRIEVKGPIRLPCFTQSPRANQFEVQIIPGGALAAMKVRYFQRFTFRGVEEEFQNDFDWYSEVMRTGNTYTVLVNYLRDLEGTRHPPGQPCAVDSAYVIAAAGGPDWPEWASYHDATISEIARPDSFTNVKGGLGMFSGIYPDTALVDTMGRGEANSTGG